jgi:hypothetical protein
MNLVLDFTACIEDDCNSIEFCDTTCVYDPLLPANCCDGYGVLDNPTTYDTNYTRFNWTSPDGEVMTNLDLNWKRGSKSYIVFEITNASTGILIVDFDNVIIGSVIAVTDKDITTQLMVNSINSNTATTGWVAETRPNSANFSAPFIVITNVNYGNVYNNKLCTLTVSGDVTTSFLDTEYTAYGTNTTECFCITPTDLAEASTSGSVAFNSFADGIHTITYIIYDSNDDEVSRQTKKFLFMCHLINGIKELITSMANGTCGCSHDEVDERIMKLRMMIEQAQAEFDECLYECANDTVKKACKLFDRICLGC